jgi:hypothetical protein
MPPSARRHGVSGGAEGDRTLDLSIANAALSQLSYGPTLALRMLARMRASFKLCEVFPANFWMIQWCREESAEMCGQA